MNNPKNDSKLNKYKKVAIMVIIEDCGKYLLVKRSHTQPASGYWCPISGTVESGETEIQTVKREVMEEVGINVKPLEHVAYSRTQDGKYFLSWWIARIVDGNIRINSNEIDDFRWYTPDELQTIQPMFASDRKILLQISQKDKKTQ